MAAEIRQETPMRIGYIWPRSFKEYQTLPLSFGVLQSNIADQGQAARMFNLPLEGWAADG